MSGNFGNTSPYKRRLQIAGALLAGSVALSGCADMVSDKLGQTIPPASASPSVSSKELQQQKNANESLRGTALNVANSILDDANNAKARVSTDNNPNNSYSLSNYDAMQADNAKLVDSTIPQILIEYRRSLGEVRISSEDYYFPSNSAPNPEVYKGIRLTFSVPPNNALDTKVLAGAQVSTGDFRAVLSGSSVILKNAQQQSGIPYVKDMMEQQWDGNYLLSHEVADPNTPTTGEIATPSDISVFNGSLQGLEAQLSQGIH